MITHIIYHIPGKKVGCTTDFRNRDREYKSKGYDYDLEVLEELHDKTDKEAGDTEWDYADKFGYKRGVHYSVSMYARSKQHEITRKMIADGTSHLLGSRNPIFKQLEDGNNPVLKAIKEGNLFSQKSSKNGTHWWNGSENPGAKSNQERLDSGIHHFQGENHPMRVASRNGTHPFKSLGDRHSSRIRVLCPWCGKETNKPAFPQFHGPNATRNNNSCKSISFKNVWTIKDNHE